MSATTVPSMTLAEAARIMREAGLDRIASKITEGGAGCWEWQGARQGGYGRVRYRGKTRMAHRVVYELLCGPIPDGLTLDHLCRNEPCVNPTHLEPTSLAENIMRGTGVGVRNAAKTHCRRGHEFTSENTYLKSGKRVCRRCSSDATRRWERRTGRKPA
jgi:hypothetical protein